MEEKIKKKIELEIKKLRIKEDDVIVFKSGNLNDNKIELSRMQELFKDRDMHNLAILLNEGESIEVISTDILVRILKERERNIDFNKYSKLSLLELVFTSFQVLLNAHNDLTLTEGITACLNTLDEKPSLEKAFVIKNKSMESVAMLIQLMKYKLTTEFKDLLVEK